MYHVMVRCAGRWINATTQHYYAMRRRETQSGNKRNYAFAKPGRPEMNRLTSMTHKETGSCRRRPSAPRIEMKKLFIAATAKRIVLAA